MLVQCPVCHQGVLLHAGYIYRHSVRTHKLNDLCPGSGTPYRIGDKVCMVKE